MGVLFHNHLYQFVQQLYSNSTYRDTYMRSFIELCLKSYYKNTCLPEGEEAELSLAHLLKIIFKKYMEDTPDGSQQTFL